MTDDFKAALTTTIRQTEADCKKAEANFRTARAALEKFYESGPHHKKKSGRPGFWKSTQGLLFVREVDHIRAKKRNRTIARATQIVRTKTIQRGKWCQTHGLEPPAAAATLAKLPDDQLPARYSEARRYWSFLIDAEWHQNEEQSLTRNLEDALAAWVEAATTWKSLVRTTLVRAGVRNPYDFS